MTQQQISVTGEGIAPRKLRSDEQRHVALAIDARDSVRQLAAATTTNSQELNRMAERLDLIAKQIGLTYLTLRA